MAGIFRKPSLFNPSRFSEKCPSWHNCSSDVARVSVFTLGELGCSQSTENTRK
jgi:hypothetical protein